MDALLLKQQNTPAEDTGNGPARGGKCAEGYVVATRLSLGRMRRGVLVLGRGRLGVCGTSAKGMALDERGCLCDESRSNGSAS